MRDVFGSATNGTGDAGDRNRRSTVAAEHDGADDTPTRDARATGVTRRQSLIGAGTLALGATAGCLDAAPLAGGTRESVEPEPTGDDPDATPGEFYYMLENNGIVVDELYYDTEDEDLILFYESTAETHDESDEEIALIYIVFRDGMVDRGADVNHLYTEVVNGFEGQVEGWGANSTWAEQELENELVDHQAVWDKIVETMIYPDDSDRAHVGGGDDGDDDSNVIEIGGEDGADDDGATENETDDGGDADADGNADEPAEDDATGTGNESTDENAAEADRD